MSDTILLKGLSDCSLSCCKPAVHDQENSVTKGKCCHSEEAEHCACSIEYPDNKAVPVNIPAQKITYNETVFHALPAKCVFCIDLEISYAFGEENPPLYFVSQTRIFSGRSPPETTV